MQDKFSLEDGQKISNWLMCNCENYSDMHCICEGIDDESAHDPEATVYTKCIYKILRCPSCKEITILKYTTYVDDVSTLEFDYPRYVEYIPEILYSPSRKRHTSIPREIIDVISQAERVISTSPRAAFILCRSVLEEVCREHNISGKNENGKFKNLETKLNELVDKEKNLPENLKEIMHGIRLVTNEGVHGSQVILAETISNEEVKNLIDLVDYIFYYLYIEKFNQKEASTKLNELQKRILGSPKEVSQNLTP